MSTSRHPASAWGVIFDLDDTLYPRATYIDSAFRSVAHHLQRTEGMSALAVLIALRAARDKAAGTELQKVCEQFALPPTSVGRLRQIMRAHRPEVKLPAVSRDVLRRLRADGWRLGVLTNGLPAVQRRKIEALDVAALVDYVVYAEEHSRVGKPEPRAFRVILERLRVAPSRCVFVGDDRVADISGARAVGLHTIWLSAGVSASAMPAAADACAASLAEVPDMLSRLKGTGVSSCLDRLECSISSQVLEPVKTAARAQRGQRRHSAATRSDAALARSCFRHALPWETKADLEVRLYVRWSDCCRQARRSEAGPR